MTATNVILTNIAHQEHMIQPNVLLANEDVEVQKVLLRVVIVPPEEY